MIRELIGHPWLYLQAGVSVTAAAVRVARLEPELAFDELVRRLRASHGRTARLANPRAQAQVGNRLLRVLPPWRMGICLKRSLVLAYLWNAHGLQAQLHLGVRKGKAGDLEGHAWLTVDDPVVSAYAGSQGRCKETLIL